MKPTDPHLVAPPTCSTVTPRLALRPREAACALGIGIRLLWELTNRGEIPHVKAGRCTLYPVDQLAEWLRDRAEGGGK